MRAKQGSKAPQSIDEKIAELRAATREANEAAQGLREVKREIDELRAAIPTDIRAEYTKTVREELGTMFRETGKEIQAAADNAEDRILARLDRLAQIVTRRPREDLPTAEELIQAERVIMLMRRGGVSPTFLNAMMEQFLKARPTTGPDPSTAPTPPPR